MSSLNQIERAWDSGVSAARRHYITSRRAADALRPAAELSSGSLGDLARFVAAADRQDAALIRLAVTAKIAGGDW